jgi:hypothetical protein
MGKANFQSRVEQYCTETAEELAKLPVNREALPAKPSMSLVFPLYSTPNTNELGWRVSEQEARQVFCSKIKPPILYSIETPTRHRYRFLKHPKNPEVFDRSRTEGRSASLDATLYLNDRGSLRRMLNVEFKAHNVPLSNIAKDFLKLMSEGESGVFFHLLPSADRGTLPSLMKKYSKALCWARREQVQKGVGPEETDGQTWFLMFAICILRPSPTVSKNSYTLLYTKTIRCQDRDSERFTEDLVGWKIQEFQ